MHSTMTKHAVREAILDATDRRLARFGYKKMTIDELAADPRPSVSRGCRRRRASVKRASTRRFQGPFHRS
jgi:hypothetical protein